MQRMYNDSESLMRLKLMLEKAFDENNMELALECSKKIDWLQIKLLLEELGEQKKAV